MRTAQAVVAATMEMAATMTMAAAMPSSVASATLASATLDSRVARTRTAIPTAGLDIAPSLHHSRVAFGTTMTPMGT